VSLQSLRVRLSALEPEDDGSEGRPLLGQHEFRRPELAVQPGVELEDVHGDLRVLESCAERRAVGFLGAAASTRFGGDGGKRSRAVARARRSTSGARSGTGGSTGMVPALPCPFPARCKC
jgi:hypothetical protein